MLQNKCNRFYLGTHTFIPTVAVNIEMDNLDLRSERWVEMVRLKNRFSKMNEHRWPRIVLDWDVEMSTEAWASEVKLILNQAGCLENQYFDLTTDLEDLQVRLLKMNRHSWKLEAHTKSKLDTFLEIHDFGKSRLIVKSNLDRRKRSLIVKLKAGVFPTQVETGRYKGTKKKERVCHACNRGKIEDERHFLFLYKTLKSVRIPYLKNFLMVNNLNKKEWVKCMQVMLEECNVKEFAKWLEAMYLVRRAIIYR